MFNNKKWKVNFYRVALIISIVGISLLASDAVSDYLSTLLFHDKPYGSIIAVVVGVIMFILEGFSYLIFKGLLAVIFSLAGWFVVSRFIEKTSVYNYILCKTDALSVVYGWIIWIGFSLLPVFVLYLSSNFMVINQAEFNSAYKHGLVKLNGHIDETMTYKIQAKYLAKNKSRKCKAKLTDRIHSKSFDYSPQITSDTLHAINIPLDTIKENFCHYQIYTLKICLARKDTQQKAGHKFGCYTLFKAPDKEDSMYEYMDYRIMYDGHVYQAMKNNKLNIYCGTKKGQEGIGRPFCTQDRRKKKSIIQYLETGNQSYLVNIYDK